MRAVLGVLSLLIVLLVVALLAKKQLGALSVPAVQQQHPALVDRFLTVPVMTLGATPQVQSEQIQQQIKQSLDAAMQQRRSLPDEQP
ncbi:MAG: hypothetical protein ABIQ90_09680 [Polaromonas sp.]